MRITEIRVDGLRNLRAVEVEPGPAVNLLQGPNGAGKTSFLEAIHLLAHGRSFRSGMPEGLIRRGANEFGIFCRLLDGEGTTRTLAMARRAGEWLLRRDGQDVPTLIEFVRSLPAVTFEPESHQLITGPSEQRRRYLDWLLFHVEPDFLPTWRRYLRSLRQRNAALRAGDSDEAVAAWEGELATSGTRIDGYRQTALQQLVPALRELLASLLRDLELADIDYRPGWPADLPLAQALAETRGRDRERGFTLRGPHRSDWRIDFEGGLPQTQLSRGQTKLTALACLLAQGQQCRAATGSWPIFACDDLASELDARHQDRILAWLEATGAQVFLTGTGTDERWESRLPAQAHRFHVEQGRITGLV